MSKFNHKPTFSCYFCGDPVSDNFKCKGCSKYICDACDNLCKTHHSPKRHNVSDHEGCQYCTETVCFFCKEPVDGDALCRGCDSYVCSDCDKLCLKHNDENDKHEVALHRECPQCEDIY